MCPSLLFIELNKMKVFFLLTYPNSYMKNLIIYIRMAVCFTCFACCTKGVAPFVIC